MGNTMTGPTPEEKARKMSRSDFAHHPSLTPVEPVQKTPLPAFVPVLTVPEGRVHKIPREKAGNFEGSVVSASASAAGQEEQGYVFQPNRTLEHISGQESKIRYVRHFGSVHRRGKLYFLRSRTVERKEDASAEEKLLAQMLDEIKAQNAAFKTLEAKQMRKLEQALEEMVGVVSEQLKSDGNASATILEVRIKNAIKSGEHADLMNIIISQWLSKLKKRMGAKGEDTSRWGKLKTNILRAKPWLVGARSPTSQLTKLNELSLTMDESIPDGGSMDAGGGDSSAPSTARLGTPDSDGLGDTLNDTLGDTLGDTLDLTQTLSGLETVLEEEQLELEERLLEDFLSDLSAAEPEFDAPAACSELRKVFQACGDLIHALYDKYVEADYESATRQSVSLVQFQIYILEVNCAIEGPEAKDVYDSLCGFDWDKSPKKKMTLKLFAHALIRAASLYLENIMSHTGRSAFTDFDGKQVASHLVELLRRSNTELNMGKEMPVIEGIADIRVKSITSGRDEIVAGGGAAINVGAEATGQEAGGRGGSGSAADDGVPAQWRLNPSFRINGSLLEDLCEEVEDPAELRQLLAELYSKTKELQRVIIEQFAEAAELEGAEVHTDALDQHVSREKFIAHAAKIDSMIDAETSDDVFSQLCGYPFEKVQKSMDLHIYTHAWVRLANLYSMFAAADGNADFVDIVSQMDFLALHVAGDS